MPTRIYLVRHGATDLTTDDYFAGSSDVPLSDEGCRQVARLAERLKRETFAAVYASPLKRTLETAHTLAQPHALAPITEPALREIDYGHWEGLPRALVETRFPAEYARWQNDPLVVAPQGGESGVNVLNRLLPAIRAIVERHRQRTVLVVSHKGSNRLLISSLLGLDPRGYRERLEQSPAALNIIEFAPERHARLCLLNDIAHYSAVATTSLPHT